MDTDVIGEGRREPLSESRLRAISSRPRLTVATGAHVIPFPVDPLNVLRRIQAESEAAVARLAGPRTSEPAAPPSGRPHLVVLQGGFASWDPVAEAAAIGQRDGGALYAMLARLEALDLQRRRET
ncbi:MAG: hypothetical protein JWO85_2254 [Candidatus Eremiobacteraeota bacterium]|nr:hypothetical protein [Candidatus Eremiobacteraeota bacterium]